MSDIKIPKHTKVWLEQQDFPLLLVLNEKYGQEYRYAEDADELLRHAREVVAWRRNEGYYDPGPEPEVPSVTEEVATALAPGRVRDMAMLEIKAYKRGVKDHAEALEQNTRSSLAEDATLHDEERGLHALTLLRDRKDYEYEGFELADPLRSGPY